MNIRWQNKYNFPKWLLLAILSKAGIIVMTKKNLTNGFLTFREYFPYLI